MRLTEVLALGLAAATLTTGAFAAGAAPDPLRIALQRADMPPNTVRTPWSPSPSRMSAPALRPLGVTGLKGASFSYTWPAGGTVETSLGPLPKEWRVSGDVFVAPNVAGARKLFDLGRRARIGFFSDFPDEPSTVRVSLPSYGDQQFGLFSPHQTGVRAMVFVRRGTVVWQLQVGESPLRWRPTRAQVLAVLRTYAPKQKLRVGRG